jgi:hypothetical protein
MNSKSQQHRRQRPTNNTPSPISYEQALNKAMEALWDADSIKQTRELADKIYSNSRAKVAA